VIEHIKTSPNWSSRPDGVNSVWGAILHHTGTGGNTGQAVANFFAMRSSEVSAHDVIDEKGVVWHCVPIYRAAWHAGQCRRYDWDRDGRLEDWEQYVNSRTGGIELCNSGSLSDDFPNAQLRSCALILRRWDKKCPNFKLRNITDHQTVNLNGKIDMRPTFPAAKLFWFITHPNTSLPPGSIYKALPSWARQQVDEIKRA
jgi:N-acetylmuramoyl-L-alanine amidase